MVRPAYRKRLLFGVLVGVAVVAIPGRVAWSMRASSLTKASETRDEVHRLQDQVAQARRDSARANELNDQLQALSAALPAEPDLPSVVEQLEAVARESNVSFVASSQTPPSTRDAKAAAAAADSTTTTPPATTGKLSAADGSDDSSGAGTAGAASAATGAASSASSSFLVEVDVIGTASNLTAYVEKIRALPRVLTVERLAWTWQDGATGGAGSQAVTAHFSIRAYTWAGATRALPGATATPSTAARSTGTPTTTKAP